MPKYDGAALIGIERDRQRSKGYDAAHDAEHTDGTLLQAGILVALDVAGLQLAGVDPPDLNGPWPDQLLLHVRAKHDRELDKLVIAGAMLAAEIDRLIAAGEAHRP
jgi:hypothetical protein